MFVCIMYFCRIYKKKKEKTKKREAYLEPCQTSMNNVFAEIVNC